MKNKNSPQKSPSTKNSLPQTSPKTTNPMENPRRTNQTVNSSVIDLSGELKSNPSSPISSLKEENPNHESNQSFLHQLNAKRLSVKESRKPLAERMRPKTFEDLFVCLSFQSSFFLGKHRVDRKSFSVASIALQGSSSLRHSLRSSRLWKNVYCSYYSHANTMHLQTTLCYQFWYFFLFLLILKASMTSKNSLMLPPMNIALLASLQFFFLMKFIGLISVNRMYYYPILSVVLSFWLELLPKCHHSASIMYPLRLLRRTL